MFLCVSRYACRVNFYAFLCIKIQNTKSGGREARRALARRVARGYCRYLPSRGCVPCASAASAAVHKCIAPRRRNYRLYIYRITTNRTHVCPVDTRVSYLKRILPSRARPDAAGGGRARERLTPPAAEGVRGREGATRPVARQVTLSLHLHRPKGALILCLHRPKGTHTLCLRRGQGLYTPRLQAQTTGTKTRRLGRAQSTTAREHRTTARDTAQSRRRRAKQATTRRRRRERPIAKPRDHWGDYTKLPFCTREAGL